MNKYRIIYADPPWSFSSKELQKYNGERFTPLEKHYETQGKDWIKELDVNRLTEEDAALFLWTTDAHIQEALEVIKAWGFTYKTIAFVWEKKTKNGKTCHNLGAWTMKNYEICLFATKGAMLQYKEVNNIPQKVAAIRRAHSQKPHEVRKRIEQLFGEQKRLEMFAREKHEGWDIWGNELDNDVDLLSSNK